MVTWMRAFGRVEGRQAWGTGGWLPRSTPRASALEVSRPTAPSGAGAEERRIDAEQAARRRPRGNPHAPAKSRCAEMGALGASTPAR